MPRAGYSHSKGLEEVRGFRVRTASERRWAIVRECMLCDVALPSSWQLGFLVSLSRTFNHVVEAAAVADAKLSVDVAHMVFGGAFCDGEFVADVLNGASANEQFEHFGFSCGKPGPINHNIALCFDGKRQREGSFARCIKAGAVWKRALIRLISMVKGALGPDAGALMIDVRSGAPPMCRSRTSRRVLTTSRDAAKKWSNDIVSQIQQKRYYSKRTQPFRCRLRQNT